MSRSSASAGRAGRGSAIAAAVALVLALGGCGGDPQSPAPAKGGADLPELAAVPRVGPDAGGNWVWLGDSITHHAQFTQYLETLLITRFPGNNWQFANRGVAGDRAGDVLTRMADDPVVGAAGVVVLQLGMNDGGYRKYREETVATFRRDLGEVVSKIKANGAGVVLVSPTVYDVEAEWRDQVRDGEELRYADTGLLGYDDVLRRLWKVSEEVAGIAKVPFVDVRTPLLEVMRTGRKGDAGYSLIPDSLHPSPLGHAMMAATIVGRSFSELPVISDVLVARTVENGWRSEATNAQVLDIKMSPESDRLSFSLQADSLPWMFPEEIGGHAQATVDAQWNRELLRVKGLTGLWYLLTVDSHVIGSYSAEKLAAGIDLGSVDDTPQREQAMEVARLNAERNQGPVRSRQDWQADRKNRQAALAVAKIEEAGGEDELQAEFDEWLLAYEQALVDLDLEEQKLWQQVVTAAQPVARRYQLQLLRDDYRPFGGAGGPE